VKADNLALARKLLDNPGPGYVGTRSRRLSKRAPDALWLGAERFSACSMLDLEIGRRAENLDDCESLHTRFLRGRLR
jgi:hypothetical protein